MGQYFIIVNKTKKEYLHPHKLASGLKFWEILASNSAPRVLAFLLRQSNEGGGGDYHKDTYQDNEKHYCGRWANDRICIVGDYDESQLYEKAQDKYTDITDKVLKEYNEFIEIPEYQVDLKSEGWRDNKANENKANTMRPDMIVSVPNNEGN